MDIRNDTVKLKKELASLVPDFIVKNDVGIKSVFIEPHVFYNVPKNLTTVTEVKVTINVEL